jgi:hypothetical protein
MIKKLRNGAMIIALALGIVSFASLEPNVNAAELPPGTLIASFTPPAGPFADGQTLNFSATVTGNAKECVYGLEEQMGTNPTTKNDNQVTWSYELDYTEQGNMFLICSTTLPWYDGGDTEKITWDPGSVSTTNADKPTQPGNLKAVPNDDTGDIVVSWTASTDSDGIKEYRIHWNWGAPPNNGQKSHVVSGATTTYTIPKSDYGDVLYGISISVSAVDNGTPTRDGDSALVTANPASNGTWAKDTNDQDDKDNTSGGTTGGGNQTPGTSTDKSGTVGVPDTGIMALVLSNPLVILIVGLAAAGAVTVLTKQSRAKNS